MRRGPVVYCVESVDNGPMVSEIMLDGKAFWEAGKPTRGCGRMRGEWP